MKKMKRRDFLKTAAVAGGAAVAGFPTIVKASTLGKNGALPASDRIVMAGIGFGMMGPGNMEAFLEKNEVQWVAVCDLDDEPLARARDTVNKKYGAKDCATYKDFRELFLRRDLDAVSIAVPDHWHAILSISAARAGFDIYGEKPFSHSLREGRAMVDAVKRYGRVWQTGAWQRSVENFHQACELVRNGRVGKIRRVEVGLPSGHYDFARTFGQEALVLPPRGFDYDFWVGPAPWWPYCKARVHMNWRWNMDFGGGQLMDWIGHHLDIAHWGMGWDGTGPVEVEASGEYPTSGIYNSPTRYYCTARYADGTPVAIAGGHEDIWPGTKWIGEHGWVWVDRGQFETEPESLKREVIGPEEVRLTRSRDHYQNFLDCVRSRATTITPVETAHRSASVGHLCVIAMEVGRKIRWDPATETILGDPEAERLLGHAYRKPWSLPE
jgi:predicted dehydrogenase